MKLEIYQVGKVPPLTVVECDEWATDYDFVPRLKCYSFKSNELCGNKKRLIAVFILNNVAGFKEVGDNNENT